MGNVSYVVTIRGGLHKSSLLFRKDFVIDCDDEKLAELLAVSKFYEYSISNPIRKMLLRKAKIHSVTTH